MARPNAPFSIKSDTKVLILCEGPHDQAMFRALSKHMGLDGIQTTNPIDLGTNKSGVDALPIAIATIASNTPVLALPGFLVVTDNDRNPASRIKWLKSALGQPTLPNGKKFPVPKAAFEIKSGTPSVAIVTMPGKGKHGDLETLLLSAARKCCSTEKLECVDKLIKCAKIDKGKLSKSELRAILMCRYSKNPEISFALVWRDCPEVIPIDDGVFSEIAEFLKLFHSKL